VSLFHASEAAAPAAAPSAAVQVAGLTKRFGLDGSSTLALDGLDLTVDRGEFVTVVGASGCGKSTLLSVLAGLDAPTAGTARVHSDRVALMFQDATLMPWLTTAENVELALTLRGVPKAERKEKVDHLLRVVRLGDKHDKRPHELSGGMRQRVALARMLAQKADVVLMDEPFGALDAMTRDTMHDEIEQLWRTHGLTVLFVTHNVREAVRLGDRVLLLSSSPGRLKQEFPVELPRPRRIDSAEVATLAATLTHELREEVRRHVG
jgi:NitT/TauT family transport system ATP-binding protein